MVYCPAQARKIYGREYTKEELLEIICVDRDFYVTTEGGVTFSGGECMLYPEFVADMAKRCQAEGIFVAVHTVGVVPYAYSEKVLPYADIFLYDIKCLDSKLHRKETGCGNKQILDNLERLRQTGKQIIIRIPEIPDFNEGEEAEKVKAYCDEWELPCEVLSYHKMGEGKRRALEICPSNL